MYIGNLIFGPVIVHIKDNLKSGATVVVFITAILNNTIILAVF